MPISITNDKFKFLNSGTGSVDIEAQTLPLDKPLDPNAGALLTAKFNVQAAQAFSFGPSGDARVSISAGTTASLTPFFQSSSQLTDHGLGTFFDANPHKYILALDIGAQAALAAGFTYSYSTLSVGADLKAGVDGEYFFCRAYDTDQILGEVLADLVTNLRPPSSVAGKLAPGEVIFLGFGGYLNFGLNVSVGYEMKGTHSLDIANLLLSESYSLSLLGKVGLTAGVAGNFSIQLRAGETDPAWVHVSVQKKRSNQLAFAADVTVGFTDESQGLPGSAQDFLGALLGVNAKNWLNFAQQILSSSTPDQLKNSLDNLSEHFMSAWVDKAFDALGQTEFQQVLDDAHKVVESYLNLDTTAINLFDKYFSAGEPALVQALQQLRHLTSLDQLAAKYTDSSLIKYIEELTGGDPLAWILGKVDLKDPAGNSLTEPILDIFNGRVEDALSLLQDDAHGLIKKYITLAKSKFGIDGFVKQLEGVTTFDGLKQKANDVLNSFVERIIGRTIDSIDKGRLGKVLTAFQNITRIENDLYSNLKEALNQTATFALHAEYSRARENDALLEIEVNPATAAGTAVLREACRGNLRPVLGAPITADYRIMGGTLLDQLTKTSKLTLNIAGWHSNFHYSSVESVIVSTQQQIVPGDKGMLTVFTTVEMKSTEDVEKNHQQLHAAFLLRTIGETQGSINTPPAFDHKSAKYLMDTITGMSASYRLLLEDSKATKERIADFLKFGEQFSLSQVTDVNTVIPFMEPETVKNKVDYGDVAADYEVRFVDQAIAAMFKTSIAEQDIRKVMRLVTLGTLLADEALEDLGWAYWTQAVHDAWAQEGGQFRNFATSREFPVDPSPFPSKKSPERVQLPHFQLFTLSEFFSKEEKLVKALLGLQQLCQSSQRVDPGEFASRMQGFADSFSPLDAGVRTNAMFSVFDKLIALTQPSAATRGSSLKLTSKLKDSPARTKVFLQVP
ncbi:MAG TPA: hypothetical protein VF532_10655 [Candidatus Angelobacter sp.]